MHAGELDRRLPGPKRVSAGSDRAYATQKRPQDDRFQWLIPPRMALVIFGSMLVGSMLLSFATVPQRHATAAVSMDLENQELDPQEGELHGQGSSHHATTTNTRMGEAVKSGKSGSSSSSSSSSDTAQPNVIFVMLDDMGMNDIGLSSSDMGELTPFMDSLIGDGVHLMKYYTNHICTPARVSSPI